MNQILKAESRKTSKLKKKTKKQSSTIFFVNYYWY
jgi:hypothetical protein